MMILVSEVSIIDKLVFVSIRCIGLVLVLWVWLRRNMVMLVRLVLRKV